MSIYILNARYKSIIELINDPQVSADVKRTYLANMNKYKLQEDIDTIQKETIVDDNNKDQLGNNQLLKQLSQLSPENRVKKEKEIQYYLNVGKKRVDLNQEPTR
jgi:hypothetical protein